MMKWLLYLLVNTLVGTAASVTGTAGMFGRSTEEYGQTLPAVLEPHGMNFWTAQTCDTELKCRAPYYYRDSLLQGFRSSHWIVGGCTQDYGSMTLMPVSGTLRCQPWERASLFSHDEEVSRPDYYAVLLRSYGIRAEMTGRSRSAIFNFDYPAGQDAFLVVNPNSDEGEGYIEVIPERRQIRGYNPVHRIYQGKGERAGFSGWFVVQFQDEFEDYGTYSADSVRTSVRVERDRAMIGAWVKCAARRVTVKVATSFTGWEGCEKNLDEEIPHWDFERTRRELADVWQRHLGRVEVESDDTVLMRKFYSAMYRASFLPHVISDVDGCHPAFAQEGKMVRASRDYYDDFSMWDTYRALHPLLNILSPRRASEMMGSLVDKCGQGGWLPIFPCWNSYTAAMIGDHCIAALGDACVKGLDVDIEKAYEAMRKNAFVSPDSAEYRDGKGRRALDSYLQYGYIPLEDSVKEAYHKCEQVSRTLEYAYDDFVLAQVARRLGRKADHKALMRRSRNYRNVIDPATGYAQGRHADGTFLKEDNAFNFTSFITEGAPCHYTWYVPHDVEGLMRIMGGRQAFASKLDSMFTQGRYWHGNEPCHQVAYLFDYAGMAWKTQQCVRHILDTEYLDVPGGLSGNDDAGQMSAWYIFSALGFYPVCPGKAEYALGYPVFNEATIHLENGRSFTIRRGHDGTRLNGRRLKRPFIMHDDIMRGGVLEIEVENE